MVYGHGTESEPVTVDAHEFDLLRRHVGASTLVDLAVDGKKSRPVIVHGDPGRTRSPAGRSTSTCSPSA